MQRTIWKYQIHVEDGEAAFDIPSISKLVAVGPEPSRPDNRSILCLWFSVVPNTKPKRRAFVVLGTGMSYEGGEFEYCGSVVITPFAWHVFERIGAAIAASE